MERFYQLYTMNEIAKELGLTRQRIKLILDRELSSREQNYIKELRSNRLAYLRQVRHINYKYGKTSNRAKSSQSKN